MTHNIIEFLRAALIHYGYWAIVFTLLVEHAGVPLPGETVLLLASFLASSEQDLRFPLIVAAGTLAATLGGILGFVLGYHGGRPLLERNQQFFRIGTSTLVRAEALFAKYGALAVFFSRFLFGLRILAGPLAGVSRMSWKKFVTFNFLGAIVWVTAISAAGFFFGQHWERLMHGMKEFDIVAAIAATLAIAAWWWKNRRRELS